MKHSLIALTLVLSQTAMAEVIQCRATEKLGVDREVVLGLTLDRSGNPLTVDVFSEQSGIHHAGSGAHGENRGATPVPVSIVRQKLAKLRCRTYQQQILCGGSAEEFSAFSVTFFPDLKSARLRERGFLNRTETSVQLTCKTE